MTKKLGAAAMILPSLFLMMGAPALAQTASTTPGHAQKPKATVDIACMAAAVDKRETAIIAATTAFNSAVISALQARQTSLKSAWTLTDRKARHDEIRAAWNTYRKAWSSAQKDARAAKKTAWQQFLNDRKACGPGAAADDPTSPGVDLQ